MKHFLTLIFFILWPIALISLSYTLYGRRIKKRRARVSILDRPTDPHQHFLHILRREFPDQKILVIIPKFGCMVRVPNEWCAYIECDDVDMLLCRLAMPQWQHHHITVMLTSIDVSNDTDVDFFVLSFDFSIIVHYNPCNYHYIKTVHCQNHNQVNDKE